MTSRFADTKNGAEGGAGAEPTCAGGRNDPATRTHHSRCGSMGLAGNSVGSRPSGFLRPLLARKSVRNR